MVKIIFPIILFLTVNLYGQGAVISSAPLSYGYLVYRDSLSAGNLTTIKDTFIGLTKNNRQPSTRFHAYYNTVNDLLGNTDFSDSDLKISTTTTRIIFFIDAQYNSLIDFWVTAKKAKKICCLWGIRNNPKTKLNDLDDVYVEKYIDYEINKDNKDWCLKTYVVDKSTPIK